MKEQHFISTCREEGKNPYFRVKGLSFLDNGPYSFSVASRKTLGLCGPSGIGKTQLLRALVDVIPHTGEIFLDGVPCSKFEAPLWRKLVTYVPPDSAWWHDRVKDHFPDIHHNTSLEGWIDDLGFSIDVMSWQVSRLSTGERQRVALLRALVNKPRVLLLDEPSSALDSYYTEKMEQLLNKYQDDYSVPIIWVTHDRDQLQRIAHGAFSVEKTNLVSIELI